MDEKRNPAHKKGPHKGKSVREEESNVRFGKIRSEGIEESRCRKCLRDSVDGILYLLVGRRLEIE